MAIVEEFSEYIRHPVVRFVFWVRMSAYFLIFVSPFWGILLGMYLDAWDGDYYHKYQLPRRWYQRIDPIIDFIEYLLLLPLLFHSAIWNAYLMFLIWRTIGMLVYYFIKSEKYVFVLFPNIAEYIAVIYFLCISFGLQEFALSKGLIIVVVLFKLSQEIVLNLLPNMLYVVNNPPSVMDRLKTACVKFNENFIQ